jgi:hypothetical protein
MKNNSNNKQNNQNIFSNQSKLGANSPVDNLHSIPIMNNTCTEGLKLNGYQRSNDQSARGR